MRCLMMTTQWYIWWLQLILLNLRVSVNYMALHVHTFITYEQTPKHVFTRHLEHTIIITQWCLWATKINRFMKRTLVITVWILANSCTIKLYRKLLQWLHFFVFPSFRFFVRRFSFVVFSFVVFSFVVFRLRFFRLRFFRFRFFASSLFRFSFFQPTTSSI